MKPKILIVDDDREIRALFMTLHDTKSDLTEAANGLQAMNEIACSRFDCVISDVEMPGMTVVELARRVKKTSPRT